MGQGFGFRAVSACGVLCFRYSDSALYSLGLVSSRNPDIGADSRREVEVFIKSTLEGPKFHRSTSTWVWDSNIGALNKWNGVALDFRFRGKGSHPLHHQNKGLGYHTEECCGILCALVPAPTENKKSGKERGP